MAKYAAYILADAAPQAVKGWYEQNELSPDYPMLPPIAETTPPGFIVVSDEVWAEHLSDLLAANWTVVNGVVTHAAQQPAATPTPGS